MNSYRTINQSSPKGNDPSQRLQFRLNQFKRLDFQSQALFLTKVLFTKAKVYCNDEKVALSMVEVIRELAEMDFYEIVEFMENDQEMCRWLVDAMDSLSSF